MRPPLSLTEEKESLIRKERGSNKAKVKMLD